MAVIYKNYRSVVLNSGPLILLYYLSISEIDTQFSNLFEILSFNLQIIIIYYWFLKDASILGSGHVFLAGIINDKFFIFNKSFVCFLQGVCHF